MREPFARVENRLWRTQFYVCVGYEKPSLGDTDPQKIDGYYDKKEAEFKCRKINAAHRAEVRKELEAFVEFVGLTRTENCQVCGGRGYVRPENIRGFESCSNCQKIDIDAFMEREG